MKLSILVVFLFLPAGLHSQDVEREAGRRPARASTGRFARTSGAGRTGHPTPEDFFRTMDDVAGEDLRWFWKGWFLRNWAFDVAVADVSYMNGNPVNGAIVTLRILDRLAMPLTLRVTESGGASHDLQLPIEGWLKGDSWQVRIPSTYPLTSVVVDPDERLPVADRTNNGWHADAERSPP